MNRILCILMLALLSTAIVQGQENRYVISGIVTNEADKPVPYCTIAVWQMSDSSLVTGGVSDETGAFQIVLRQTGRYELRMTHLQYETLVVPLNVDQDVTLPSIRLMPSAVALDELTVVGAKSLIRVMPDKIVFDVRNTPEAKTASLREIFEKLPLVTPSGSNYLIRGHIAPLYLINGKRSALLSGDPVNVLKNIPAGTIKEIEVITNPGAGYDGDNSGGIINIITKDKEETPLSATAGTSVDTRGSTNENVSLSTQIRKLFVQASYMYSHEPNYKEKSTVERINESSPDYYLLRQEGNERKTHSHSNMVMLESSWKADTANIVNMSFNYIDFKPRTHNTERQRNTMWSATGDETFSYLSDMKSRENYRLVGSSADYQRQISRNGRLLLMYKFTDVSRESDAFYLIGEARNYSGPDMHNRQAVHNREHTMQADYSNSWADRHFMNVGVKYIIRNNTNDSQYDTSANHDGQWDYQYDPMDHFDHRQEVMALYAEYEMRKKNWSVKAGLRDELTTEKVRYANDGQFDFDVDFNNPLPFLTMSYDLNSGDAFTASFRSRIFRPGIAYLNPKVRYQDPSSIYYGNPDIDCEQHRTIGIDYTTNRQKYTLNLALDYTFCNNSIENYYGINDDNLYFETYDNSGSDNSTNLSGYVSFRPSAFVNIGLNVAGSYIRLKDVRKEGVLKNSGLTGSLSSNISLRLLKGYDLSLSGTYNFPRIDLQGRYFNFYYCAWTLSKSICKDRFNLSLSGRDMFWKNKKYHSRITDGVKVKTDVRNNGMAYGLSVVYRFNSAKISAAKTSQTIYNDDVKDR